MSLSSEKQPGALTKGKDQAKENRHFYFAHFDLKNCYNSMLPDKLLEILKAKVLNHVCLSHTKLICCLLGDQLPKIKKRNLGGKNYFSITYSTFARHDER